MIGRVAVQFENVSKSFRRGEMHDSLRDAIGSALCRLRSRLRHVADAPACGRPLNGPYGRRQFWALRDVSFDVRAGEALGIIGPNGAGKSTALKLLAGILRPDTGQVHVHGRLSALIEISAGLHGDLTGRENIFLGGAIMGMSRREIRRKLDAIVEFSGLEEFLDTPVKRYSSGMQARLGFSVAAHVDPDVLLVDEVLSVGDVAFRQRCEARMRDMVRQGVSLVFVTHNLEQMRSICRRTAVLDRGRLAFLGDPGEAVEHYLHATLSSAGSQGYTDCPPPAQTGAELLDVRFLGQGGSEVTTIRADEPIEMAIDFRLRLPVRRLAVEVTLRKVSGELFVNFNSARDGRWFDATAGVGSVRVYVPSLPLGGGAYLAYARMWDTDRCQLLAETPLKYSLHIDDRGRTTGLLALPSRWAQSVQSIAAGEGDREPASVPEPAAAAVGPE